MGMLLLVDLKLRELPQRHGTRKKWKRMRKRMKIRIRIRIRIRD